MLRFGGGLRQGVDDLLLAVNVGVEQTQNVVEVALKIPLASITHSTCITHAMNLPSVVCFLLPFWFSWAIVASSKRFDRN